MHPNTLRGCYWASVFPLLEEERRTEMAEGDVEKAKGISLSEHTERLRDSLAFPWSVDDQQERKKNLSSADFVYADSCKS